jgi:tRNA threonylcarbamoyladenosine biosynthesis protein TsaB
MNNLLAIETSEEACSAALLHGDERLELFVIEPRRHSELILPMVDQLLSESGLARGALDAIAFGRGPGSFTGVRIATAVAQGIGFGLDIPVIPVSTLQALAQGACRESGASRVLAAMDARMQEVYWGAFVLAGDTMQLIDDELVTAPSDVPVPRDAGWTAVGSGWDSYVTELGERVGKPDQQIGNASIHAQDVADIARFLLAETTDDFPAGSAIPVYLRNRVTHGGS